MRDTPIELCFPLDMAEQVMTALDFAIRRWDEGFLVAGAGSFSPIAFDARRLRSLLNHAPEIDGCRRVVMAGAVAEMLHLIARELEEGEAPMASLSIMLRASADAAAEGDTSCIRLTRIRRAP